MGEHPFSIDSKLCKAEINKLNAELEDLNGELEDIFRRATLNDHMPIAQVIVDQLGATPKDLKMLSKVFDRLAVKIALRNDLAEKLKALQFIGDKESWLYERIGAPERDVEHFLASTFNTDTENTL